ncbi:hypothetical protein IRB23SM22_03000 [Alkalibacterium sp. s-m-22]|uniref:Uncharacterized protein n=1 Tax=Alkalibacterium indicireducens TaxID=398758 RepID=A0ABN1AP44_9LACT
MEYLTNTSNGGSFDVIKYNYCCDKCNVIETGLERVESFISIKYGISKGWKKQLLNKMNNENSLLVLTPNS